MIQKPDCTELICVVCAKPTTDRCPVLLETNQVFGSGRLFRKCNAPICGAGCVHGHYGEADSMVSIVVSGHCVIQTALENNETLR